MSDSGRQRWQRRYDEALASGRVRDADFTTLSGGDVEPVYGPADEAGYPGFERIGWPGEFPFTRGLHATGYRGRRWTLPAVARVGDGPQAKQAHPTARGRRATGCRGRSGTMRQFAGFGNARQTNERYRMILGRGGGGLSVAFDMPTLMGRDSADPRSLGGVGRGGGGGGGGAA